MVELKGVNFSYSKKKKLFDNLNLKLGSGKIYGLLGCNGAGKTTLLKLITSLCFPLCGEVCTVGHDSKSRNAEMLKEIYFLPEEIYLPDLAIHKFIMLYSPFYKNFDYLLFKNILEKFEINYQSKIKSLSFGQQKKLSIAFAISTKVSLLVLDEPTNGLDILSKIQFKEIIRYTITEKQSYLISTHSVKDLESILSDIIIINDGKINLNNSISEIATRILIKNIKDTKDEIILYKEETPLGFNIILKNEKNKKSEIDIELLYKAIIENPEINNIINHEL